MSTVSRTLALALFLSVVGCAVKLPPVEPTYDRQPAIQTQRTAKLGFVTGAVLGTVSQPAQVIPAAGIFIAVPAGAKLDARFGIQDQQESRDLLAAELERLSIVRTVLPVDSNSRPDFSIDLEFARTELVHQNLFYILDVKMTMKAQGKQVEHKYHIDVHEQDSSAERWNSTYSRNKVKAKKLLLRSAIPEIEDFLASIQ